jgi:hypothetical protein
MARGVHEVIEHLPSKHESWVKKKKTETGNEGHSFIHPSFIYCVGNGEMPNRPGGDHV